MTGRPDAPGPLMRRGPRPLLLHLTLAMLRSHVSRAMSPHWKAAWLSLSAPERLALLQSAASDLDLPQAVHRETLAQDAALIAGIAAYRRHPWRRVMADPPVIWREGGSRLLDYAEGRPGGIPMLFVPSLINRAYVLDLREGGSMLRWLAGQGVRPLLLDWGWPREAERRFSLTDYVAGRLERAMATAAEAAGTPLVLAGYCMGGTLAVAAAQRRPDLVSGLVLLAAPWDFHAPDAALALQAAALLPLLEPALALQGALPVDLLQALFALLDPWGIADKYRAFSRLDQAGERATLFVALEDWLNDGVPLAAQVARACLGEWYGGNAPAAGTWRIAGLPVDPTALRLPSLVVAPRLDRIVPPQSALPLAGLIAGARVHQPEAGHIGMMAGARAEAQLWRPLLDWLQGSEQPWLPALRRKPSSGRGKRILRASPQA